jgi:hypothetical protein
VLSVLVTFQLLEPYFQSLPLGKNPVLPPVTAAYLTRRVLNEPNNGASALLRIRNVAAQLALESTDGRIVHDYVEQLCPLVVTHCADRLAHIWRVDEHIDKSDYEPHVNVAALYTQTMPVIARWIDRGAREANNDSHSWLFGSAKTYAVEHGNHQLLALMMTERYIDLIHSRRLNKLRLVAESGSAELTQFVWAFNTEQYPWEFSREKRPGWRYKNEMILASIDTPSIEVFEFLTEKRRLHCINRVFGCKEYTRFLCCCARKGWADMAARYLDLGASVDGRYSPNHEVTERPLVLACKNGHRNVVDVLLARGADTSQPVLETAVQYGILAIVQILLDRGAQLGEALSTAVAKGYRDIVEILLDHDTDIQSRLRPLLVSAVEREDEVLFGMLLHRGGGVIDADTGAECARVAQEKGLQSMLEILTP